MKTVYTKRNFPEVSKGSEEQISELFHGLFQLHFGNFHQIQDECSFKPSKQLFSLLLLGKCCICNLQCRVALSNKPYCSGVVSSLVILQILINIRSIFSDHIHLHSMKTKVQGKSSQDNCASCDFFKYNMFQQHDQFFSEHIFYQCMKEVREKIS